MSGSVQSILARCIVDVPFLDLLARDPGAALEGYALDERTRQGFHELDVERLRRFAGLITKVQNNGLWQPLPYTRALMNGYGLESDVFVAYVEAHQRNRAEAIGRDEQTRRFLGFLGDYLERRQSPACPGLRDVLVHERVLWEIERFSGSPEPPSTEPIDPPAGARDFLRWIPVIRGTLRVEAFATNPLATVAALQAGVFRPEDVPSQELHLGYFRAGGGAGGELRILELAPLAGALLSHVDGRRSLRRIVDRACAGSADRPRTGELRAFFESSARQGLLTLQRPPGD